VRFADQLAVVVVVALLAPAARADSRHAHPKSGTNVHSVSRERAHAHVPTAASSAAPPPIDARASLADQLAAERETIDRTIGVVGDKLSAADVARQRRLRAAYRVLHAPIAADASDTEKMAAARRRAAARILLDRDTSERSLLVAEADHLRTARERTTAATERLPTIVLPVEISRPARGKIVRHFGPFEHERSHATLSRHGLDFEVDDRAQAHAVADGIVRYAGPIRGLDRGVIIDHGDYVSVVAKLGELVVPVGTRVVRGDRVGRAARHRVYLEVRVKVGHGGLPIDPAPLLPR
jgi:septal ring factor EnvC (AmiA/AmiB activator)